ncbi:MAG: NUDIX domain-containing protein [Actinobacteria bacterium]|jgi:8-oxo-dGTP diphosphatase|nr:NUDIX domain-containing protein [Actinomycetota bacterium]MBT3687723.1 NUDIX domain-containing protein [Actinomycetota bacterium]MBT4036985.1 NUDIX domain-containing protein [Actinomycetota bacterium]MBT4279234.1 NUDIX domain-containing protein [Actinomycetota bacterium]MBT4344132.1 NUDIX domain-containing protein [Actinomycetota bacterium]
MIRRGTEPGLGMWSLPGGRVEAAESVVSAVLRELEEETDLEGLCGELIGWVERSGVDHHYVILNFRVTILGDAEPVAGDDAAEARWVSLEEVSGIDLVEGMERFLIEHGVIADGPVLGVL